MSTETTERTATPYTLRYLPDTELTHRKHALTVRKFATWVEAEDHRLTLPYPNRLEVVERYGAGAGAGL